MKCTVRYKMKDKGRQYLLSQDLSSSGGDNYEGSMSRELFLNKPRQVFVLRDLCF